MKATVFYVVVIVLLFSLTLSQPTHDFNQVSECGCQQELEMLRNQITLLKEEVHSIRCNEKSDATCENVPTTPSTPTGLFKLCSKLSSLILLNFFCAR